MTTVFMLAFAVGTVLVYCNWPTIHRWWAKGCKACLIEIDLDDTANSRSWAHAATPHTCWLRRNRARTLNAGPSA